MPTKRFYVRTQAEVSEFFGVSIDTVKVWSRGGMPKSGRSGYNLGKVAKWLRYEGPWRANGSKVDDPLLAGADSPGLERYRLARAAQEELKLEEKLGRIIDVEKAQGIWQRVADVIRHCGWRLGERYDSAVTESINDAIDECSRILSEMRSEYD
jgi:phage terminase Nu1 subunit (DNA packaging protein)